MPLSSWHLHYYYYFITSAASSTHTIAAVVVVIVVAEKDPQTDKDASELQMLVKKLEEENQMLRKQLNPVSKHLATTADPPYHTQYSAHLY